MARPKKQNESSGQPSVRVYTDWDPLKIKTAERMAETGNLSYAARVCEWLLGDDRVAGVLSVRSDALLGLEPSFELGAGRRAKQAQKALEAGEDWWQAYPESELTQLLTWGILLGVAPARHRWEERTDHAGRILPMPCFWHPHTLRWDWQQRKWFITDAQNLDIEVVAGAGEWILHAPFGAQRPWSYGLWRSLARWALLKQFAISDWARHSEKGAMLVATAPEGSSQKQRKELADDLAASGDDAVVALAAGFDLKLVEVSANTEVIYKAQIQMADLAIAIRIRGGNLSTNVEAGSLAAAKSQADTGDRAKLRFDASSLSSTLHDQSLVWWAEFNFGDRRLAPWPIYPVEPEEDKGARASMLETLGNALTTFDTLGFEINPKKLSDEFGLSFLNGRPRDTRVLPSPLAPGKEPNDGEPERGAKKKAPEKGAMRAQASTGFLDGQLYVDDLVDSTRASAGKEVRSKLLERLLAAIDGAETYEEVRDAVLEAYGDCASPAELRDMTRKALVLADLAGAAAVQQDN